MASISEVKGHGIRLFAKGEPLHALRLYDSIVVGAPFDFVARMRVGDCLVALGRRDEGAAVYRAVARYALKSGHPLVAVVLARVLRETLDHDADDLMAALVVQYGSESELVGSFAARINVPDPSTNIKPPDLHIAPPNDFVTSAAKHAAECLDDFEDYPESLHPIPLLSELSEAAFRKVIGTLVVRRLPDGAAVIRQGESGQSFFFVASGEVRVFATDSMGRESELARLHEGSVFGEMALLSAEPRSASVFVVGEADLLEVTRESLSALADELEQVAGALHRFTRDRLLKNMMATNRLFKPFDRGQQRDLLRRFTSHDVPPGTHVIRQGDQGAGLFVVLSGEVEVSRQASDGEEVFLATLRPGDVFGEMALVKGGVTSATVTATKMATVLFLSREYVDRIIAGVPEIKAYLVSLSEDRELDTQLSMGDEGDDDKLGDDDVIIFI